MNLAEKSELSLIVSFVLALFIFYPSTIESFALTELLLKGASLLLIQGLIRDLWYLFKRKQIAKKSLIKAKYAQCFCIESSVGLLGIVIGLLLIFINVDYIFQFTTLGLSCFAVCILIIGFVIKDLVIEWQPWRIYKEPDHINVVFQWKRK